MTRPFPLRYQGFAYRQTDSADAPLLVLFVAAAEELLLWAGIPRRTESATMGFQRIDDPERVERTKEFFNMPPNQSPTALIIGVHQSAQGQRPPVELLLGEPLAGSAGRPCELVVHANPDSVPLPAATQIVRAQLQARLADDARNATDTSQASSGDDEDYPETSDEPDEAGDEFDDENGTGTSDQETGGIERTHSLLEKLLNKLDDSIWLQANSETIVDMAKPATIIDGQHRIKGAAACEREIPFAVCALMNCPWPEQVFQFTVVNYKSEGIPDQFITANAALSLTETELEALEARLVQARVKVIEYELMKCVQFDEKSPFHNLVNLTEAKDLHKIGYKTMVRVAKDWYSAAPQALKANLLPALFVVGGPRNHRQRLQIWQEEHWDGFFLDYWQIVYDHYSTHRVGSEGHSLWSIGHSNLMIAIVLYEFQKMFFADLNAQDEEFFEVPAGEDPIPFMRAKLRQRAKKFVSYFPSEFFAAHWETKSLNTSAGRKALQGALSKLLQTKGRYQYGKSALITGEIG